MEITPPLFSSFTLFTEILVTAAILTIFYTGYKHNRFRKRLAFVTIMYEILFNISYMSYRAILHETKVPEHTHTAFHIAVAAFHCIMAILMFIALVVYLILAMKKYEKGINYFKEHKYITFIFLFLWFTAIGSGLLFYYLAYFTKT
jgi:hypothetical protein